MREIEVDLLYIDANNIYGLALSMKLPQRDLKWMFQDELAILDVHDFEYSGDVSHLLSVNF